MWEGFSGSLKGLSPLPKSELEKNKTAAALKIPCSRVYNEDREKKWLIIFFFSDDFGLRSSIIQKSAQNRFWGRFGAIESEELQRQKNGAQVFTVACVYYSVSTLHDWKSVRRQCVCVDLICEVFFPPVYARRNRCPCRHLLPPHESINPFLTLEKNILV